MHKLVASVFKAIMYSILFVFIFDMVFYAYRAFSINQRMETIMTSMQKVVMENNYLPEGDYLMYKTMFQKLAEDMNGGDTFILGIGTNYNSDPIGNQLTTISSFETIKQGGTTSAGTIRKQMSKPASTSDLMIVQARVRISQPFWGWTTVTNNYSYNGESADKWVKKVNHTAATFYYTYYVPCMKVQSFQ